MSRSKRRPAIVARKNGEETTLEMSPEAIAQLPDVDESTSPYAAQRVVPAPYAPAGSPQRVPETQAEDLGRDAARRNRQKKQEQRQTTKKGDA